MNHLRLVLHAMDRTGPPMLALAYLGWLRSAHPDVVVDIVSFRGGALEQALAQHGEVRICLEPSAPWDHVNPDPDQTRAVAGRTTDLPPADVTLLVSVAAGQCLPFLPTDAAVVVWSVEQGEDLHWLRAPLGLAEHTTRWLAGTAAVAGEVAALVPGSAPSVVPEFVGPPPDADYQHLRAENRAALGVADDEVVVVGAGIATQRKGPDLFVEIATLRGRRRPDRRDRYRWIGGEADPLFAPLQRECVRLGIDDRVDLVASVADLHPWLAAADVFLHPARLDAFPLVCLHAASMGVPVVAFAGNGGVEAMFGDAFMGAPYPDMVALARVLDRLDDAADRARVGVAQRAIVEARWSSAVAAPRLHDHLVAAVAEDHR